MTPEQGSILNDQARALKRARVKWIEAHGSTRLRKAVALDLLDAVLTLYREERLAHERPEWLFPKPDDEIDEIRNPSEAALDLLAEVRREFPRASLVSVRQDHRGPRFEAVCIVRPFGDLDDTPRPALCFVQGAKT